MKIAFITNDFPILTETFILNLLTGLIDAGWDIDIVSKNRSKDRIVHKDFFQYQLEKRTTYFEIFKKRMKRKKNVLKIVLTCFHRNPQAVINALNLRKFGILDAADNLFYLYPFLKRKYDLLHCQFGPNGCLAVNLKALGMAGQKILTTFHGYDAHFNRHTYAAQKLYYEQLFKQGDHFTANTPYLKEQLVRLGCPEKKITLLPMGVDTRYFVPCKAEKTDDIIDLISVGRLSELKGHKFGIYAVKTLLDKGFPVRYTIIGMGDKKKELEGIIKNLGIGKHIRLIGPQTRKNVKMALQKSDIYLMTSVQDAEGRRETQGVVTAEAQACGLPVVGFRSGGVRYTMMEGQTGFLSEERDIDGFASSIQLLIENSELREKMGKNAVEFIQKEFSTEKMILKLSNLYAEITN